MVIARCADTVLSRGPAASLNTRRLASSGIQREIGSASEILPSSMSIKAATEVIGLVIEAMRNNVSDRIGVFVSISHQPSASA